MNERSQFDATRPPLGETDQESGPPEDAISLELSRLLDLDWLKGLVIMLTLLVGLVLIGVIWQVENNVLAPRISGRAVGLHPLGAMFALLAGFQLAGLLGGLFAVPLAGLLREPML